jgi:hypothetical protein
MQPMAKQTMASLDGLLLTHAAGGSCGQDVRTFRPIDESVEADEASEEVPNPPGGPIGGMVRGLRASWGARVAQQGACMPEAFRRYCIMHTAGSDHSVMHQNCKIAIKHCSCDQGCHLHSQRAQQAQMLLLTCGTSSRQLIFCSTLCHVLWHAAGMKRYVLPVDACIKRKKINLSWGTGKYLWYGMHLPSLGEGWSGVSVQA